MKVDLLISCFLFFVHGLVVGARKKGQFSSKIRRDPKKVSQETSFKP
jgi:hypothetical protein